MEMWMMLLIMFLVAYSLDRGEETPPPMEVVKPPNEEIIIVPSDLNSGNASGDECPRPSDKES
jgi:hypothetical protein